MLGSFISEAARYHCGVPEKIRPWLKHNGILGRACWQNEILRPQGQRPAPTTGWSQDLILPTSPAKEYHIV